MRKLIAIILLASLPFLLALIQQPDFKWYPQSKQTLLYLLHIKDAILPVRLMAASFRDEMLAVQVFIMGTVIAICTYNESFSANVKTWRRVSISFTLIAVLWFFFITYGGYIIP